MSKRKKKSTPADNLIESLMDDLKGLQSDSSFHMGVGKSDEENFDGLPSLDNEENRVERTNPKGKLWDQLSENMSEDLDSSEFTGGTYEVPDEEPSGEPDLPDGWASVPPSERFMGPNAGEGRYDGPSLDAGYQTPSELEIPSLPESVSSDDDRDESTSPVAVASGSDDSDRTVSIQQEKKAEKPTSGGDGDKTVAVEGFANARVGVRKKPEVDVKVSIGNFRGGNRQGAAQVFTSVDASLAQAENLKIAQQRILELEGELETLRTENEELASAGEIIRNRTDEYASRITALEKEKQEAHESAQSEILILKASLQHRETETAKARLKVDELETRLKSDFKKIRVRERELENRLELLRAEKAALIRSKDEYILEQKRKIDQLSQELDNYRKKCLELNKTIEANQDQVKRTERALRLALSNLEAKEESPIPLKKAE